MLVLSAGFVGPDAGGDGHGHLRVKGPGHGLLVGARPFFEAGTTTLADLGEVLG